MSFKLGVIVNKNIYDLDIKITFPSSGNVDCRYL